MPKSKDTSNIGRSVNELDNEDDIISQPELQPETEVSAKKLNKKSASSEKYNRKRKKRKNNRPASEKSALVRAFSAFSSKISRGIRHSGIANALTSHEKIAEAFRKTWLYGLFFSEKNTARVNRTKVRFRKAVTDAKIPKLLERLCSALFNIKTRIYGLILLMFGITTLIIHYFVNSRGNIFTYDAYAPFTAVCICAFAIVFVFSNDPLSKDIYESKFIGSLLFDLMGVTSSDFDEKKAADFSPLGAFTLGILLGLLTLIFSARSILLVILLIIYAAAVIKSPEAGIISILLISPFASLDILVVALSLLTVSYIFKALCGKRTIKLEFSDIPIAFFMLTVLSSEAISFGGKGTPITSVIFIASYFIVVSILRSEVWFNRAVRAVSIGVSVMAVVAILIYCIGEFVNIGILGKISISEYRGTVSQVILYASFILLAELFQDKRFNSKILPIIMLLFSAVYICFTLPATAILAAVIALCIFFLLCDGRSAFFIAGISAIWVIVASFVPKANIIGSISTGKDAYTGANLIVRLLSKFGFTGIGSSDSARDILHSSVSLGSDASLLEESNLFFSLALELGYIGLIMFVISFFFILQNAFSFGQACIDRNDKYRLTSYATMCGLICAFIYGFWGNTFSEPRMLLIYWLLAGFTVAGSRCTKDRIGEAGLDIPLECY